MAATTATADDVARLLARARSVVVVPGYGLAVAQGHHALRVLTDALQERGVDVAYAVHPLAGRLPGHLNVLLDAAGVPPEAQLDLAAAATRLATADVALVVGAADVVNTVASTTPGSPLCGVPVLDVARAGHVVVLDRATGRGFAGVVNPLLGLPTTRLLRGDAARTLVAVVAALAAL